jgi:signal transduction histidine kinase
LRSMLKKAPLEFKQLDLGAIIREVIEILEKTASRSRIAIQYMPPATAIGIQGDAIHLQQVLMNLIVNAMDAISDAGCLKREVVIRLAPAGRFAEVTISDSGPGISADKIQRIFDPFFTTKQDGMGMGLSIVQTIVRAHNGRVSVDSQTTSGAVFRLHLPIASPR